MFKRKKKKKKEAPVVEETFEVEETEVFKGKYRPDPNRPKDTRGTQVVSKSPRDDAYPLPDDEIDAYSVDTRIWERVQRYVGKELEGIDQDTPPHTHESYADKEHEHEGFDDTELQNKVEKNSQDIKSLVGSLADTFEVVSVLDESDWTYAGEDRTPRDKQFSTDDWFFHKVKVLKIHKRDFNSVTHDWKGVVVGDEVTIRYNENPEQPVNERYFGKFLVTEIVTQNADILFCSVTSLDAAGTIVDDRRYSVSIRGTRPVDLQEKLDEANQATWGKKFKNDTGYLPYANNSAITSGRMCWSGGDTLYLSKKDDNGNWWFVENQTHATEDFGHVYEAQSDGSVKVAARFSFTGIQNNSNNVKVTGVTKFGSASVSNNKFYLVRLGGGWL